MARASKNDSMPESISPMLCTLTKELPNTSDYIYEIKWDGYRIISYVKAGAVKLASRGGLNYTSKYPPVKQALSEIKHEFVIDGEVVVFDVDGVPSFDAVQKYNGNNTPISYCVFDLLWLDGKNLMNQPLSERKEILKELVKHNPILRFSESFTDGHSLYEQIVDRGLEGVVAKRINSEYLPGDRSNNWLKKPTRIRQEFVIGGWAESDKSRSFRSLLFGAYNDGKFEWIGRSGGGYKEKEMPGILAKLKALEMPKSPFVNKVLDTKGATLHWVKPELVANFEFAAWTTSGRIRKPATFLGFREDKSPTEVVREVPKDEPAPAAQPAPPARPASAEPKKLTTMAASNWPKVESQKIENSGVFEFGDCTVELQNIDRKIWPDFTKADLINYYHSMADYILPHLKDRPQSLHLKLVNANAPGLFIKDMEGRQPDCAEIFPDQRRHHAKGKRDQIDYLVCNNEATLLWIVNLGCIDINPWNSQVQSPTSPDYIVIDLDPTEADTRKVDLAKLIDTAMAAKEYCDSKKIKAFAKTSGKTGMHFYVPCAGFTTEQARVLAERICNEIHLLTPAASTTENSIAKREAKVYVDPSQNDYADTLAAPYSVRPFHKPTVSTPLKWNEINSKLNPADFTVSTILQRVKNVGDLFSGVLDKSIAEKNALKLKRLL